MRSFIFFVLGIVLTVAAFTFHDQIFNTAEKAQRILCEK